MQCFYRNSFVIFIIIVIVVIINVIVGHLKSFQPQKPQFLSIKNNMGAMDQQTERHDQRYVATSKNRVSALIRALSLSLPICYCLFLSFSVSLFLCLYLYLYLPLSDSFYLFTCLFVCLFVSLSVYLFLSLFLSLTPHFPNHRENLFNLDNSDLIPFAPPSFVNPSFPAAGNTPSNRATN